MRDVVITGTGAVGPFGDTVDAFWHALRAPDPCLGPAAAGSDGHVDVPGFDIARFTKSSRVSRAPRVSQYAYAATSAAIAQADLPLRTMDKDTVSIVYGTANEPTEIVARNVHLLCAVGVNAIEPIGFQESVYNAPASLISIEYGFRGPLLALPMGWAAGGYALCAAADLIATGQAEVVIAVASDHVAGLGRDIDRKLRFISPNDGKEARVRPFDERANGVIAATGGAALTLEARSAAEARGARILAALTGWASTNDARGVSPKRGYSRGIANAMRLSDPARAGTDVVLAGSYCTRDAERAEAEAIAAYANGREAPTVTNIRGAVGDCKGVSGLWNAVAAVKIFEHGVVPAPVGTEYPDEALSLRLPGPQDRPPRAILCNNFWVGGLNTSARLEAPA
ncbi:beta-ketoacyl synthase N-terminal-like domain-containing protein [Salinarimonas sp.]|uniref:beta-ketoacyl synthase N-terminal-like domain-containing protein n=1 Tax=Salinarimonas sp. TaxID=2766526 RepID=UPI0032D9A24B